MKIRKITLSMLTMSPIVFCPILTSCGDNTIKITIDSGVGTFVDKSTIKSFYIKPGLRLSDCDFTTPKLTDFQIDMNNPQPIQPLYYSINDIDQYNNEPLTKDTVLFAHYYQSLDEEKTIAKKTIDDEYTTLSQISQSDVLKDEYNKAKSWIDNSTNSFELFAWTNLYYKELSSIGSPFVDEETQGKLIDINDETLQYAKKVKNDKGILTYINVMIGFYMAFTLKHSDEYIEEYRNIFNVFNKHIENINPDIYFYYSAPFDALFRGCAQQNNLIQLLDTLDLFGYYYTLCSNIHKAFALSQPIVAINSSGVMRPDLIPWFAAFYKDYAKQIIEEW